MFTLTEVFDIYNLIIVDDEEWSRLSIEKYIEAFCPDFEVKALLSSGRQAIEYINKNNVDVVITDVRMSNIDGLELAEHIFVNNIKTKVIIISGYSEFEYVKMAIKFGVQDYLTKLVNPSELVEVMERVKQRLDDEKNANSDNDNKLEISLFFYDLLGGFFSDKKEAEEEYNKLNFEKSFDECVCEVLEIRFVNFENYKKSVWKHNENALENAIINIIDFVFGSIITLPIEADNGFCKATFFCMQRNDDISKKRFVESLKEVLQLDAVIENAREYTLEQICSGNMDEQDGEIEKKIRFDEETEAYDDSVTANVIKYINEHYNCSLTREKIAAHFHMHSVYLGRLFKKATGKTLFEYITDIRMKHAIEFLESGFTSEEVCQKVGYEENRSFRRAFKRYFGCSVSEYKKSSSQKG